jgi:hypothetical protein
MEVNANQQSALWLSRRSLHINPVILAGPRSECRGTDGSRCPFFIFNKEVLR